VLEQGLWDPNADAVERGFIKRASWGRFMQIPRHFAIRFLMLHLCLSLMDHFKKD
jgi:hypothetical protein